MKKSLYIFLVLMFCNVANAKDLTGTSLLCKENTDPADDQGLHFIGPEKVIHFSIGNWKVQVKEKKYWVDPVNIFILGYKINRETLVFSFLSTNYQCSIVAEDFPFNAYFIDMIVNLIREQESKNKL